MGAPVLGNNNSLSPQENIMSIRLNFDDINMFYYGAQSQFMKGVVGRPCPVTLVIPPTCKSCFVVYPQ